MITDWEQWSLLNAQERLAKYDEATDAFKERKELNDEQHWIVKQLVFGDTPICDRCEERVPNLMLFEAHDEETLKNSPERLALENLGIEWHCCADCIEEDKRPICKNCGRSEHHESYHKRPCVKNEWISVDGERVLVKHEFEAHEFVPNPLYEVKA